MHTLINKTLLTISPKLSISANIMSFFTGFNVMYTTLSRLN